MKLDKDDEYFEEKEDFSREKDDYTYIYEGESLQYELELVYEEQYHAEEKYFDEYMHFNKKEDLIKE